MPTARFGARGDEVRDGGDALRAARIGRVLGRQRPRALAVGEVPEVHAPVARADDKPPPRRVHRARGHLRTAALILRVRGVRVIPGGVLVVFASGTTAGVVVAAVVGGALEPKRALAVVDAPRDGPPAGVGGDDAPVRPREPRHLHRVVVPHRDAHRVVRERPGFRLHAAGHELPPFGVERQAPEPVLRVVRLHVPERLRAPVRAHVPHPYRLRNVQREHLVLLRDGQDVADGVVVAEERRRGAVGERRPDAHDAVVAAGEDASRRRAKRHRVDRLHVRVRRLGVRTERLETRAGREVGQAEATVRAARGDEPGRARGVAGVASRERVHPPVVDFFAPPPLNLHGRRPANLRLFSVRQIDHVQQMQRPAVVADDQVVDVARAGGDAAAARERREAQRRVVEASRRAALGPPFGLVHAHAPVVARDREAVGDRKQGGVVEIRRAGVNDAVEGERGE